MHRLIQHIKQLIVLKLFLVLPFCFMVSSSTALNLDSLWGIWNDTTQADTNRLEAIYFIAKDGYLISKPDSAFYFAGLGYELAKSVGSIKWEGSALYIQGISFYVRGNYVQPLKYFEKGLKLHHQIGYNKGKIKFYNGLGLVYCKQGKYDKALNYHHKNLIISENEGNKHWIAHAYTNIAGIYNDRKNYKKAIEYSQKSLKIREELGNKHGIVNAYVNMGVLNNTMGNYDKAMYYYQNSIKILLEISDDRTLANTYKNIGSVYLNTGNFSKAFSYFQKGLKLFEQIGDNKGMADSYYYLARFYFENRNYSQTLVKGEKAFDLTQKTGALFTTKRICKLLYKAYKKTGQSSKALEMHELYIEMSDSIKNEENTKALIQQQYKYEYDKKAATDSIKNSESDKVMDAELQAIRAQNDQQSTLQYILFGGILLLLIFSFFVYKGFRKTNEEKKIIELQNKQIVDRITYSQKVQQALLPSADKMISSLLDVFIFYEPKDIVSGDFYWLKEFDGHTIIACVDCTGHGVPGGFMSTMGSLLMDRISVRYIRHPSEILTGLSEAIIRVLCQEKGGAIQDGMDMAICIVDHANKKMEFSGARNGVIIINEGKVSRYKADLYPVGGNYVKKGIPIERKFNDHSINLEEGDWVYMFTDGYVEQLGGKNATIMKYKRFEEILIKLSGVDGNEAKSRFLKDEIEEWKGLNAQNDDMLIMGFQLS